MNIAKLKKQAKFFIWGATLAVLMFLCYMLASFFHYGMPQITPEYLLLTVPPLVLTILSIVHAFFLLCSVAKEETPFTQKNALHLQWIGWAFVAYEPVSYLIQTIQNRYFPLTLPNGMYITSFQTYGGIFLICGFVVLAVATIFRYGMELQQLSDETL